jgi:hypothetical protein
MNKNTRFFGLASLGLLVALMPAACSSDDDDDNNNSTAGTTSNGGSSTNGGSSSNGGGGKSSTAGTSGSGATAGTVNLGGGDDGEGGAGGAVTAPTTSRLRVVHASPNAPKVDIYPKGSDTAAIKGVAYGDASGFIEVDAGTIAFDIRAAGADSGDAPAFTTQDIDLTAGAEYTIVAAGDFEHQDDEDVGFRVLPLEHDFEAAATGTAIARVVHATSAWDTVDLDVVASDGVDVEGIDRFGSADNVSIPSGATIDIDFQHDGNVLTKLVLPRLTAKSELFVIATGNPGFPFRAPANGFALLVVDQDGKTSWVKENPWLHIVHASDIGKTDIYEATHTDDLLVDNLAADTIGAFQLPASSAGFNLRAVDDAAANGAATTVATGKTSSLVAGDHYLTYIAANTIQNIHEQFDLGETDKVLLRAVHAARNTEIPETLDIGPVDGTSLGDVLFDGIQPASSSDDAGISVDPGDLTLGAAATGTVSPLLASRAFEGDDAPVAGETDFVLVTGVTTGTTSAAKLWLVNTSVAGWAIR